MKHANVISHSHWDREWYLPYEAHHMLLVEFMDRLLKTLEEDPEFKCFHLDGQTILLDDYLEVRPENRDRLKKLIQAGRIHIGPWYVLQDEFLTSSEANIRNLQTGFRMAAEYGAAPCRMGYFPDSFGNMGQAPQILKKAGIDAAVFGRGVKPTGFNNQVTDSDSYESPYSEMYWESGDGSSVLAVLFANWYSNGNEIPVDRAEAEAYWNKRLADASRYASTDELLFMNGCDHQPVQTDISDALKTAGELGLDVDFRHTDFEDYISRVRGKLPEGLAVIKGELRSQQTNGWYTLSGTASSRIYMKQMNARCQMLYEKVAEPIAAMAYDAGMEYPHHLFYYGWKLLMQNHPHDSICGCSVDEVHREMVTRFEKAEQTALHIIRECKAYIEARTDTSCFGSGALPFMVFNTTGWERDGVIQLTVETEKKYFRDGCVPDIVAEMKQKSHPAYRVVDRMGREVPALVEPLEDGFGYDLPKDKFRQPYIAKRVRVTAEACRIPAYGWETYALAAAREAGTAHTLIRGSRSVETDYIRVDFNEDGSFTMEDKESKNVFVNQGIYEDCGDIGNEYIFYMPPSDTAITTKGQAAEFEILEDLPFKTVWKVTHRMMVPESADELLEEEIRELVEFKDRRASRSAKLAPLDIETYYTFERRSRGVKIRTVFDNRMRDHRLRLLFETGLDTPWHYADSVFEAAKRSTEPDQAWENPSNAQHMQAFVNVRTDRAGLTVAGKGLNEYEVLRDGRNTVAVTLHRGVRELGDWGVFLTPEAQCMGRRETELCLIPHGAGADCYRSFQDAYQFQVDWITKSTEVKRGSLPPLKQMFEAVHTEVIPSALRVNEATGDFITRWYNLADGEAALELNTGKPLYETDLLEERVMAQAGGHLTLKGHEILTLGWKGKRDNHESGNQRQI